MSMKRIGVVLSGSGVQDGSEITEAVLTLLALDRHGAEAICMAPDRDQTGVVNHRTGKVVNETRNMMTEAARIARGNIRNLADVDPDTLDGVILPGGYGAAKNLSTFAVDGADAKVDPDLREFLTTLRENGTPIVALCISPVVLAALFGAEFHPEITIGSDAGTAKAVEAMGARHKNAAVTDVVVDVKNRMITTPCYMYDARVSEVAEGIEKAVTELLAMA